MLFCLDYRLLLELHALTLATHSYVLLNSHKEVASWRGYSLFRLLLFRLLYTKMWYFTYS